MLVSFFAQNNRFARQGEEALKSLAIEACGNAGATVDSADTDFDPETETIRCKINLDAVASDETKAKLKGSFSGVVADIKRTGYKGFENAGVSDSQTSRNSDLDLIIT